MLLGGLWHGAAWTFILWGLYQGVLLILYRPFEPAFAAAADTAAPRFAAWLVDVSPHLLRLADLQGAVDR